MIRGERVHLTTRNKENIPQALDWWNSPEVSQWMVETRWPESMREAEEHFDKSDKDPSCILLEIHVAEDDRFIGHCSLTSYDPVARIAELGIWIGPEDSRGKGLGEDVIRTLLGYAFDTVGLQSVYLTAKENNERAVALYERTGFRHVARLREHVFAEGRFSDLLYMQIMLEEYRQAL